MNVAAIRADNAGPKPPVFAKMEALVRQMQDPEDGIPIRCQKLFLTSIPCAFLGYDLVEWLMERMDMPDAAAQDAIHLANLLCQYGYFFPVGEQRSLVVKDDSSLYRFQTPYYWPSQNHAADTTDYAIYLTKRLSRNKQKHGLEDYELETYMKLKKGLQHKWDFVQQQAEEQAKLSKHHKKGDKIVIDSQERAYWRVYRPPQGCINCLETPPSPIRTFMNKGVRKKSVVQLQREVETVSEQLGRSKMKPAAAAETIVAHTEVMSEYDPFLVPPNPSNPWCSDEDDFWLLNEDCVDLPTELRVRRWAISLTELLSDPLGLQEFTNFLSKEFSHENIRFWLAVTKHRYGAAEGVSGRVESIYEEFLKPGAPCEVNIDGKTMEETQEQRMKPSRYTYDTACEHVFTLLLKKDCYPRFLRSDDYNRLLTTALQPSAKKPGFFANLKAAGPGRKKTSASAPLAILAPPAPPAPPLRRLGSDEHGGVHVGGVGQVGGRPPPVNHPAEDNDAGDATAQSSICPWETEDTCNVCPWETAEPPSKPPSVQTQLVPKTDTSSTALVPLPSKPADHPTSYSKSTGTPYISPSSLEATSAVSDSKTLNVSPWCSERDKDQSKTTSLGDLSNTLAKGGSNTSIPASLCSEEGEGGRFHMDRRPSMHAEKKSVPSVRYTDDSSSTATPSISLQDIHSSVLQNPKENAQRFSSDLSKVKIHIEPSSAIDKTGHKELFSSVSLPFTTIIRNQQSPLDFTVQSGHTLEASSSQPLSLTNPQDTSQDTQNVQYLSSPEPQGDSAPTTPNIRRTEGQKTLSVSSQTQTDPIVHRKTNQQTQHPSRNASKQSSKTPMKYAKINAEYSSDQSTIKPSNLSTNFRNPSVNKSQMQVQKYQKPSKTFMTSKIAPEFDDVRTHHKNIEPLQLMLDNEQHKVYMFSREELEKRHKQQKEQAKKAHFVPRKSKDSTANVSYTNELLEAGLQSRSKNELDITKEGNASDDSFPGSQEEFLKRPHEVRASEASSFTMIKCDTKTESMSQRLYSKSGMVSNEAKPDSTASRRPYIHAYELGDFTDVPYKAPEKTQSLPHNRLSTALSAGPSQTMMSSSLQRSTLKAKHEPQEPVCQKTVIDKSHKRYLSGDLETLLSSCHARQASPEDIDVLPVSKSVEDEPKLSASPQSQTIPKVWDDPGDICPWEDDTLTPTWL